MRIKVEGLLFIFSFLSLQVHAQEKKTLNLKEAIELSIQSNKELKISQAKIEEAAAALKEAVEQQLPDAKVSGSYLRLNSANVDLKTNTGSSGSGGSGTSPKVSQAAYGLVNVSLPVYSGGRIRYGIESSGFLEQAAKSDAEDDRDEVIQNTIEAFANLFKAKSAVSLVKENLVQSQRREKDLGNMEKNGLLARNDFLKAQLQTSNTELNLLDAENNLQLANIKMDLMLGLPATTELVIDTAGIERKNDSRVLDDYLHAALSSRKDIAAIDYRKKAAESGVRSVKGELYPGIALTAGYIAADIPHVLSVTNAIDVGVGVSYNIASLWKNKAKVQQAEAKVRQLAIAESIIDDNITLQVNKSYLSLLSYRKKIDVYFKAVQQAQENYRIVKNKFDNSLATTAELIDADVAQLQARLSYTLARADAFVAYHKLLQTAGILSAEIKK
jgi:outer membrane protein TolC